MTTATCEKCSSVFSYLQTGRRRIMCPGCVKANAKARLKERRDAIKLVPGEMLANAKPGRSSLLAQSRDKVADALASWEFWEDAGNKAGDPEAEVTYRRLTSQRIHQIEREALGKLRRAFERIKRDGTNE